MAKRGTFTTVSRAEAAAGGTAAMTSRAAHEETRFRQAASAVSASGVDSAQSGAEPAGPVVDAATDAAPIQKGPVRKSKRVCAPIIPTNDERFKVLMNYRPKNLRWVEYMRFQTELVSLVEATNFVSTAVDKAVLGTATAFIAWRLQVAAPENVAASLTETNIRAFGIYLESQGAKSGTPMARLRYLRRGGPMPKGFDRNPQRRPHTRSEARALWDALARIPRDRAFEGKVLWSLTFGLGLTAQEAQAATADWVQVEGDQVSLVVNYDTGEFRVVPVVDPPVQEVLVQAARQARRAMDDQTAEKARRSRQPVAAQAWLLSPHMLDRSSAISNVKVALRRVDGLWVNYDAARARGCWMTGLLESPMRFSMVCQIAGINPNTKTPTDLLRYVEEHRTAALHEAAQRLLSKPGSHLLILGAASDTARNASQEVN